jgi:hypothetical protein
MLNSCFLLSLVTHCVTKDNKLLLLDLDVCLEITEKCYLGSVTFF